MNARWLVVSTVAAVVGWLAGRATLVPVSTGSLFGLTASTRREVTVLPAGTVVAPDCDAQVAERLKDLDELRREAYGDAVPFPPDLDPAFLPAAIEDSARRVEIDCPELGWKLLGVECSEYPCFTVWDSPPAPTPENLTPENFATFETDLKAWHAVQAEALKCGVAVQVSHAASAGELVGPNGERLGVSVIVPLPPDWSGEGFSGPTDGRRKTRLAYRRDLLLRGSLDSIGDAQPAP